VNPTPEVLAELDARGLGGLKRPVSAEELLRRPDCIWDDVVALAGAPALDPGAAEQVEIDVKYAGYVERATRRAEADRKLEHVRHPEGVDWIAMDTLSWEVRERLQRARPQTLGQVGRIEDGSHGVPGAGCGAWQNTCFSSAASVVVRRARCARASNPRGELPKTPGMLLHFR